MRNYVLALLIAFCAPAFSDPADTRTPLERYQEEVLFSTVNCPMVLQVVLLGDVKRDYHQCIAEARKTIKAAYLSAVKTIKKPAARAALKEHYIAAMTRIDGIDPQFDETNGNYAHRQSDNQSRLDEKWARFEAE